MDDAQNAEEETSRDLLDELFADGHEEAAGLIMELWATLDATLYESAVPDFDHAIMRAARAGLMSDERRDELFAEFDII